MSKVPYTINVEEYVCDTLEQMRGMVKTLDFSPMPAAIERIQYHANKMENALYSYKGIKYDLNKLIENKDLTDEEFKKKCVELMDNVNKS